MFIGHVRAYIWEKHYAVKWFVSSQIGGFISLQTLSAFNVSMFLFQVSMRSSKKFISIKNWKYTYKKFKLRFRVPYFSPSKFFKHFQKQASSRETFYQFSRLAHFLYELQERNWYWLEQFSRSIASNVNWTRQIKLFFSIWTHNFQFKIIVHITIKIQM